MALSNYPPGVTGNEFAIAGPDSETEDGADCDTCQDWTQGMIYTYGFCRWFVCDTCHNQTDLPDVEDDGPDPDEARERMLDRELEDY